MGIVVGASECAGEVTRAPKESTPGHKEGVKWDV